MPLVAKGPGAGGCSGSPDSLAAPGRHAGGRCRDLPGIDRYHPGLADPPACPAPRRERVLGDRDVAGIHCRSGDQPQPAQAAGVALLPIGVGTVIVPALAKVNVIGTLPPRTSPILRSRSRIVYWADGPVGSSMRAV